MLYNNTAIKQSGQIECEILKRNYYYSYGIEYFSKKTTDDITDFFIANLNYHSNDL